MGMVPLPASCGGGRKAEPFYVGTVLKVNTRSCRSETFSGL